jgi:hypothetical protein
MTELYKTVCVPNPKATPHGDQRPIHWCRGLLTSTLILALGLQNAAWAVCADGVTTVPKTTGFAVGSLPATATATAAALATATLSWSPGIFTAAAGSLFVPDSSTNELNNPALAPTHGGHNWVMDQGSTLCRVSNVGSATTTTAWTMPPATPLHCITLPIIKGARVVNLGDVPFQGDVITPTCDPTKLSTAGAPNPANTYFNQLGCSLSHGLANTPQTAASWLFVAGIKGGMFSIRLDDVSKPVLGSEAGKIVGILDFFSAIPEGQKLTNATISPDGQFAAVTTDKRNPSIFACLNPLGDPGNPAAPINPNYTVAQANTVKCMSVGGNALAVDLTTEFGPDGQPYFGGQRVVNSFLSTPGGTSKAAWPNCIWQNNGSTSLADAFAHGRANGCGNAVLNSAYARAGVTQPPALIRHGDYMYTASLAGPLTQFKVTKNPITGVSTYLSRTYATGMAATTTGIGVADDLKSLMIYTDPSTIGLGLGTVVVKLPLCEDM